MIMVFAGRVDLNSVTPPTQKVWAGEGVTPVVLVHTDWTWSDTDKYLGIKGGKARSSHAHMDAGSFVYDAYGVRWSMDIGRQYYATLEVALKALGGNLWTYTQASLRWEVSRLNNFFHSTLTVNDSKHRVEGFATLEQTINTATEQGGTFDLSPVLEDQVASAMRTVKIVNDKDLKSSTPSAPAPTGAPSPLDHGHTDRPDRGERPDHADEQRQDHVPDALRRRAGRRSSTKHSAPIPSTATTIPIRHLPGRIRGDRARGQMGDLHHDALTRKLIPAAEKPFSPSGPGRRRRLFGAPGVRNPPKTPPRLSVRPHKNDGSGIL